MRQLVNLTIFALFIACACALVLECIGCTPALTPTQPTKALDTAADTVPVVHCDSSRVAQAGVGSACIQPLGTMSLSLDTLTGQGWTCLPTTGTLDDTLWLTILPDSQAGTVALTAMQCHTDSSTLTFPAIQGPLMAASVEGDYELSLTPQYRLFLEGRFQPDSLTGRDTASSMAGVVTLFMPDQSVVQGSWQAHR